MFYRENGQFKTTYRSDQQIFPILQDRIAILALLVLAFAVVPFAASSYQFSAILIPVVILSLVHHPFCNFIARGLRPQLPACRPLRAAPSA